MARGWESKAVEAQQDEHDRPSSTAPRLSPDAADAARTRATLMLARTNVLTQLQQACAPARRAALEQALADLDAQLARAGSPQ